MTPPARPRASWGVILVTVLMAWVTTAIASLALWPIYRGPGIITVIVVGTLLGTIIAVLGARFRWPAWLVMIVTLIGFVIVGVPTAVPSKAQSVVLPTIDGLRDLLAGVALGWRQLLTITLPVGDYEALLVPALVLVLVTVTAAISIALRSRMPEFAVIPPIVLYLVGVAFGPEEPVRAIATPIALFSAVLLWLVWFRWQRRRSAIAALATAEDEEKPRYGAAGGLRAAIGAVVLLAVSATAGVVAAAALPPTETRTVLRSTIVQPFDPRDYVSPLSGFRSFWQDERVDTVLFRIPGRDGELVRLATLDTYDGVVFSVGSDRVTSLSGSFVRVPSTFDQSRIDGSPEQLEVEVVEYNGVWLPTVGQFESIGFRGGDAVELRDSFFYNDTSGTAAVLRGLSPGDSYSLSAIVPDAPSTAELADLDPGSAVVPEATGVPEELVATLEEYVAGIEQPGERLVAMLDGLAADGYISHGTGDDEPPSRSGHAADRITELLTAPRMIGDGEQYAVTAALMARELGFPSRVILGFVPTEGEVRGGDVVARIEVSTAQYGWVALDATPPFREIPEELPEENAQVARPPTIVPPPVVDTEQLDREETPDTEQELPPDLDPVLQVVLAVLRVLGWVLVGLAILASPFLVIIAAKVRRRRLRRRAATPVERISGGWREFEDAVVDHGMSPSSTTTRSELADATGSTQAHVLAAVADRAVFSPDDPGAEDAETVWRVVDDLRTTLDEGLTRWQKLKARVSLRSLGGYSVTRLFTR